MNKSETMKELALALSKAQADMPPAELNATNPFLKNKYADLGSIIKAAKPVLAKYGLSVSQLPTSNEDKIGVTTILMHSSGEWIESTMMLPIGEAKGVSTAQAAGAIISYLRRYSLASALGMYADQDIDGNGAESVKQTKSKSEPKPETNGKVDIYQAIVDAGYADNIHSAKNALQNYCKTGYDTAEKAVKWMKAYRAWRDMDKTPQEAGKLANEGKMPK
jgi:hypothetical protein